MSKRIIVIAGPASAGKTASLRDLENQKRVLFLHCEAGKDIPFKNNFHIEHITDPLDIPDLIADAEESGNYDTVVIDSLTMMMELYESVHVTGSADTRAAWGEYANFFKDLMQQYIGPSEMSFILLSHLDYEVIEEGEPPVYFIPVKGSLKKVGLAAYFGQIVVATKLPIKSIKCRNDLLNITPKEEAVKFKYVFQTQITASSTGSVIRGPFDMWSDDEVYIDNNAQHLLDALEDYYGDSE